MEQCFPILFRALTGLSNLVYTVHACMNVTKCCDELKYSFSFSRGVVVLMSLETFTSTSVLQWTFWQVVWYTLSPCLNTCFFQAGKRFSGLHFLSLHFNLLCFDIMLLHIFSCAFLIWPHAHVCSNLVNLYYVVQWWQEHRESLYLSGTLLKLPYIISGDCVSTIL